MAACLAKKGVAVTESRTLLFDGARGQRLAGRLDLPGGKPRAVVLVAHCFGGGDRGAAADRGALSFTGQGIAVLRLLDIAERCPVHRTLHSEVLVSTTQAVLGGESC